MRWSDPTLALALEAEGTDVGRVADGPLGRVERFGETIVISHVAEELPETILQQVEAWIAKAEISIRRIYARHLVVGPGKTDVPRLVRGNADALAVVRENGLRYEVDFLAGYSPGLFLDQRANRERLRRLEAKRVLNTFAYTCAFSVAAAADGAQTLSLDLTKSALERGRRNFALNDLSLEGHRFISDDVFDVLPRLQRRGEKFDAIILDPPTFSRGRNGRVFRVEKDFVALLELATACAASEAWILLSTNCTTLDETQLRSFAREVVPAARLEVESRPPDLADPSTCATTLWLQMPR